jgi:pimeloyl-ACP methyl ester carboxylesterase
MHQTTLASCTQNSHRAGAAVMRFLQSHNCSTVTLLIIAGVVLGSVALPGGRNPVIAVAPNAPTDKSHGDSQIFSVRYQSVQVEGQDIFYREAGPKEAPALLLLHGFPTSSHMFRNLMPALADKYRVIAPDYPGFGNSSAPSVKDFEYSFDHLAKIVDAFTEAVGMTRFAMYVQDYGAPIGFRIAAAHPDRITGLIIQNGNAYDEGLLDFWKPLKAYWSDQSSGNQAALTPFLELDATKWQWTHGVREFAAISPDTWNLAQAGLDRPGNKDIQLQLFLSYGSNPPLYRSWQEYFRAHQPPTLIVWGRNDQIFPAAGAEPYKRDLKNIDFNLLETGHFALEEMGDVIAEKIRTFMQEKVAG